MTKSKVRELIDLDGNIVYVKTENFSRNVYKDSYCTILHYLDGPALCSPQFTEYYINGVYFGYVEFKLHLDSHNLINLSIEDIVKLFQHPNYHEIYNDVLTSRLREKGATEKVIKNISVHLNTT
jgi:hypothetical protein